MARKNGTVLTNESWCLSNLKAGSTFMTPKSATAMTTLSTHYKRKIKTEKYLAIAVRSKDLRGVSLTMVTILE